MLQCTPWNFENGLLVFQRMLSRISPSDKQFETTPMWIQLHDLLADWRRIPIES